MPQLPSKCGVHSITASKQISGVLRFRCSRTSERSGHKDQSIMHYFKYLSVLGLALGLAGSLPVRAQVSGGVYSASGYDNYRNDDYRNDDRSYDKSNYRNNGRSYDNSDYDEYENQGYGYSYAQPSCPYGYYSYYP